ncbi:hypothetical protein SAMN05216456_2156 [Devosia crocina]|uniref:Uncharacterized protein n=1 Tax=Devosia crocina TaxID=429728 RepID=A0A1I7NLJ6_9HYPH|nr:hypothetical protein [Devosia crocina]SFV35470.1 hypothetical protein SAMN05216456_2156 [Devosia crocina]
MHVFGDAVRNEETSSIAEEIRRGLERCHGLAAGLDRHAALVSVFIRASELVQGVEDAAMFETHEDGLGAVQSAGASMLLCLANAVAASWQSGFYQVPVPFIDPALELMSGCGRVTSKRAEGYGFYALYPESYFVAAQRSGLGPDTTVIGIRSIGVGLAAMVSAGLGAAPAFNLRPSGHPFDRQPRIGARLAEEILKGTGAYAIVDEGPGLSGSSFNGIADWLVENGVAEGRIHFFPSHSGGLGQQAKPHHCERWDAAHKHVFSFEDLLLGASERQPTLENWLEAVTGPLDQPLEDVSGGAWRARATGAWPPVDAAMEKRKFIAQSDGLTYLAKFVGLGEEGEGKRALAERVAAAGFAPRPLGLRHGFLITRWLDASPSAPSYPPQCVVLDYLAFRAGLAPRGQGADLAELFSMARYNLGERHGPDMAEAVALALGDAADIRTEPCCTDNRMHRWEWMHGGSGWQKHDGIDHHAAHDLVGCQDIAWDLVGAAVELDWSDEDIAIAAGELGTRLGRSFGTRFIRAHFIAYLGFQTGLWTMARDRNGRDEAVRIEQLLGRYDRKLGQLICS